MAVGFYWTANSPYIQGHWVRVRRAPRASALGDVASGFIDLTVGGRVHRNANPAFMVYECLTDTEWGMGGAVSQMDVASFTAAAQTFRDENFGLFMKWVQSDTIENFVSEILDHVQAFLFFSPVTGLWTLKPLRGDYDPDTLPLYTESNAYFDGFERKQPGETVNEIVVTWSNPVTEQDETVSMQDLASVVQQSGQVVSQSREYYGVRSSDLALTLAARDLRSACAPLVRCTMHAFRSAWATVPGDCVKVTVPSENAFEMVMRVTAVDYGDRSDAYVKVTLLEDIFALDAPAYTGAAPTGWQSTQQAPNPPDRVNILTAPAYLIAVSADEFTQPLEPPEVASLLLIADDTNRDFISAEPYTPTVLPTGDVIPLSIGTRSPAAFWSASAPLPQEAFTTVAPIAGAGLASLLFIGADEIAMVQGINTDGTMILARGLLDTTPHAWPLGAPVWIVGTQTVLDPEPRAPGETVSYRPLMRTSLGLLPYASGVDTTVTLTDRPYRPLRPANVKLNDVAFGTVTIGTNDGVVTWANRNRVLETAQVLAWISGNVVPEAGQTTTLELLDNTGAVTQTYAGLTGTTYTIPAADMSGATNLRVSSVRDGLVSFQSHVIGIA